MNIKSSSMRGFRDGFLESLALRRALSVLATVACGFAIALNTLPVHAATSECKVVMMPICERGGMCEMREVGVCEPDTRIVREGGDAAAPNTQLFERTGYAVRRVLDFGGSAHFEFARDGGRGELCSLPTKRKASWEPLVSLALPLRQTVSMATGKVVYAHEAAVKLDASFSPTEKARVLDAVAALNHDLVKNRIALRFLIVGDSYVRPAVGMLAGRLPGSIVAATTATYEARGAFTGTEPQTMTILDPTKSPNMDSIAHELLHAMGLGHNLYPIMDTTPGRMSADAAVRVGEALSACEASVLRQMYGHAGD